MPRGFTNYDTARIQGRLWTPAAANPVGWWDASDLSTISVSTGSSISAWRDKAGASGSATPVTTAQTIVSEIQNGLSGVLFSNTRMLIATGSTSARALVVAAKPTITGGGTGTPGFRGLTATGSTSGSGSAMYSTMNISNKWGTWSTSEYAADAQLVANSLHILIMDGLDSGSFYRNGSSAGTYAATEGQSFNGSIGGGEGGNQQNFTGYIFEVLWFSSALSIPVRTDIEGYLSWKWAIPLAADHPYVNRPPLIGD